MGPLGGFLLTLGAALSVLGTNNNTVLAGPRYLYALAETGRLPRVFAKIHPRYRTPHVAILTQTGVALALIGIDAVLHSVKPGALGVAEELAVLSTIARLATYIGTCLAVPVLRRKMPRDGADDPPARRARHPDRGARHLPAVPLGRREEEFHRGRHRAGGGRPRVRRARTGRDGQGESMKRFALAAAALCLAGDLARAGAGSRRRSRRRRPSPRSAPPACSTAGPTRRSRTRSSSSRADRSSARAPAWPCRRARRSSTSATRRSCPGFIDSHTHLTGESGDNYIQDFFDGPAAADHGAGLLRRAERAARPSRPDSRRCATSARPTTSTWACATRSTTA